MWSNRIVSLLRRASTAAPVGMTLLATVRTITCYSLSLPFVATGIVKTTLSLTPKAPSFALLGSRRDRFCPTQVAEPSARHLAILSLRPFLLTLRRPAHKPPRREPVEPNRCQPAVAGLV